MWLSCFCYGPIWLRLFRCHNTWSDCTMFSFTFVAYNTCVYTASFCFMVVIWCREGVKREKRAERDGRGQSREKRTQEKKTEKRGTRLRNVVKGARLNSCWWMWRREKTEVRTWVNGCAGQYRQTVRPRRVIWWHTADKSRTDHCTICRVTYRGRGSFSEQAKMVEYGNRRTYTVHLFSRHEKGTLSDETKRARANKT